MPLRLAHLILLAAAPLSAQQPHDHRPIQDNSFLMEEAYNQEAGVVQHISTLVFDRRVSAWSYALTDEWPLGGQRHQLSLTLPLERSAAGRAAAMGDLALNYRVQLVGGGATRLAVAPRATLLLPTAARELGGGTLSFQGAVAASYVALPLLVLHTDAGFTIAPHAATGAGATGRLVDIVLGQSAVWLVHPRLNLLVEGLLTNTEHFGGIFGGVTRVRETGLTISPGVRWSYDFASGLQIVPGIAAPVWFRANSAQRGLLLYLSFEHYMPGLKK